jgi:peptide/nickel transport system permease protein
VDDGPPHASGLKSLILPVLTLGFFQLTLIMRLTRSEMLEVMRSDFIRFARARGIPERSIELRHALRNTMVPGGDDRGPPARLRGRLRDRHRNGLPVAGLGALFVNAVQFADVPVMAAYLVFVALVFVLVSLTTDLVYLVLDPRLRGAAAIR